MVENCVPKTYKGDIVLSCNTICVLHAPAIFYALDSLLYVVGLFMGTQYFINLSIQKRMAYLMMLVGAYLLIA